MYVPVDYISISCHWCGIEFKPNRKDKKFCSQACYKRHGKKNKGHSNGNRENQLKRVNVYKRPYIQHKGSLCEVCGFVPQHLCQLDVDHIDGDHDNNDPTNLQTLCANCHRLKTAIQLGWHK